MESCAAEIEAEQIASESSGVLFNSGLLLFIRWCLLPQAAFRSERPKLFLCFNEHEMRSRSETVTVWFAMGTTDGSVVDCGRKVSLDFFERGDALG